ncbi:MAG: amidohydrolase family protein [Myxococcota bacterium]|nr:amidohydrolase family protein [Myxococcota bacterium]
MSRTPYSLFDADNHYYEPRDAFTRHLEPRFRDLGIHVEPDPKGRDRVMIGSRPFTFLENPFFETTAKPGSLREMLRNLGKEGFEAGEVRERIQPEYTDRDARLRKMDEQGLHAVLLFPTLAVCVEHFMKDDVEQTFANVRAFNRWLDEDWGFAHEGRIFAVPLLSLLDLELAVQELEWVLERGARAIHLRPGPQGGFSPADPRFDPFWARVNEAKLAVAFHISESGYNEMMSVHYGEPSNPPSHRQSAFQWTNFYGDRPIMDTFSALILHNLFGRFPDLRILSVENGSLYVPYLMKVMDKMKGMGRNGPWIGGYVKGRPSEVFLRHFYVSPYHEEDIVGLARLVGSDRVLFGSDYPHAEGLAEPADFAEGLEGLPEAEVEQIMSGNLKRLLEGGF